MFRLSKSWFCRRLFWICSFNVNCTLDDSGVYLSSPTVLWIFFYIYIELLNAVLFTALNSDTAPDWLKNGRHKSRDMSLHPWIKCAFAFFFSGLIQWSSLLRGVDNRRFNFFSVLYPHTHSRLGRKQKLSSNVSFHTGSGGKITNPLYWVFLSEN